VVLRLADQADVVIDNFRPGVMEAMGLGYETLAARNPRIIACAISGFGAGGPMRDTPGFDQIAQGFSGLMSVTGTEESGPMRVGIAICDLLGGIFAAQGILLALEARHRSGRGQRGAIASILRSASRHSAESEAITIATSCSGSGIGKSTPATT